MKNGPDLKKLAPTKLAKVLVKKKKNPSANPDCAEEKIDNNLIRYKKKTVFIQQRKKVLNFI